MQWIILLTYPQAMDKKVVNGKVLVIKRKDLQIKQSTIAKNLYGIANKRNKNVFKNI